jgi:hypothetical protein
MGFLTGTKGRYEQRSTLNPAQQGLADQYYNSIRQQGGGGAFGDVADYYRSNLSNNPADFQAFAAPEMRRFNEEIIPGISEQFAGMGAGGLSSSGFRNAAVNAGTDLSERLGALRAQLRQQSAQGLQNFAQGGLNPSFNENIYQKGQPGLLDTAAPLIGQAAGAFFGGPAGAAIAGAAGSWLSGKFGKSDPYGQGSSHTQQPAYYRGGQ